MGSLIHPYGDVINKIHNHSPIGSQNFGWQYGGFPPYGGSLGGYSNPWSMYPYPWSLSWPYDDPNDDGYDDCYLYQLLAYQQGCMDMQQQMQMVQMMSPIRGRRHHHHHRGLFGGIGMFGGIGRGGIAGGIGAIGGIGSRRRGLLDYGIRPD